MKKVYNQPMSEELEVQGSAILVDSFLGTQIDGTPTDPVVSGANRRYRPNA